MSLGAASQAVSQPASQPVSQPIGQLKMINYLRLRCSNVFISLSLSLPRTTEKRTTDEVLGLPASGSSELHSHCE